MKRFEIMVTATFYTDVKTIESVKKQTLSKKMADFKGKQPENYKH